MEARIEQPLPPGKLPREQWPDISNLVTEDGKPLEGRYQDRQMAVLARTLATLWKKLGQGRPILVDTDVGLFDNPSEVAVVPDVMVAPDVAVPTDFWEQEGKSWFVWRYGPPLLVAEIVSNKKGGEDLKLEPYARVGVSYVIIWDPHRLLSHRRLRIYELVGGAYRRMRGRFFPELGLGLTIWRGAFEGKQETWLRWCYPDGTLVPTFDETLGACLRIRCHLEKPRLLGFTRRR